jgi:RNA polymerase-associated protein
MMKLVSNPLCLYGHTCRIVMQEKYSDCEFQYLGTQDIDRELAEINPYGESPTLVDRDLVLYGVEVINEFLDERLPHPPLMPIDPVGRGRARLLISRLKRDWLDDLQQRLSTGQKLDQKSRKILWDGLLAMSQVFANQEYLLSDDFTLVDCYVAPLLWRLPFLGIKLPRQGKRLEEYSERLFSRSSFQGSLSDAERELRP